MQVTLQDLLAEIRNLSYLFYGYSVIWVIVLFYIYTLSRREQNLRNQMEELKKSVEEETRNQEQEEERVTPVRTSLRNR